MASERDSLSEALEQYVSDTYEDLKTIRQFIRSSDQWIQDREAEGNELKETGDSDEKLDVSLTDLSEEDITNTLAMIRQLDTLRKDQNFQLVNLFDDKSQSFRKNFSEVKPQVLKLMEELEGCAQQLDSMNLGARISGTVSNSVGIVGGILSILTVLGVTSGLQGIVTTSTELGVNNTQTNKAEQAYKKCVQLIKELQDFLNDVIQQHFKRLKQNTFWDYFEAFYSGGVFATSIAELIGIIYERLTKEVVADATYDGVEGVVTVSRVGTRAGAAAASIQAASIEAAEIGGVVLNGVFAVIDGYFLGKDIKSLVDGTETEFSKWIRARAALWSSEIDSWQNVHDSLDKGEKVYEEYKVLLQKPFPPLN
uniref:Uncharacterized protein n=1 Tax=Neogobius melanostomus TaxID=47308 RepID=A0A8C6T7J4_9GOBI